MTIPNLLCIAAEMLLFNNQKKGLKLALVEELEAHLHPQYQLRLIEYISMQFQTAVEYQHFADRWFKCCSVWPLTWFRRWIRGGIVVQVLAWVSSTSNAAIRCFFELICAFDISQVPSLLLLYEVLLLTWLWAKIAIFVGYLMSGWRIFVGL